MTAKSWVAGGFHAKNRPNDVGRWTEGPNEMATDVLRARGAPAQLKSIFWLFLGVDDAQ